MIVFNNLVKYYGRKKALDHISLTIQEGDLAGILGPNGAGKTTLINTLTCIARPTTGEILIRGETISRNKPHLKALIGLMPQRASLENDLTVRENLILHGKLYQLPAREIYRRIPGLLSLGCLEKEAETKANNLSGGMRRKLLFVRAVMHDPEILILDEPTIGLDVPYRKQLWSMIKGYHESGKTILITTHYLEEAESLCHSIALLKEGSLLYWGKKEVLLEKTGAYVIAEEETSRLTFYRTREDAVQALGSHGACGEVRKSRLEDIFIQWMDNRC
jgi:ABC-2 type transport system ATP-binding protein